MYVRGYDAETHKAERFFIRQRSVEQEDQRRYQAVKAAMFKEFEDRLRFRDMVEAGQRAGDRHWLTVDLMDATQSVINQYQMYRAFCNRHGDSL